MTQDWKADKSLNWLDTWRKIEKIYREHPEKVKAIGVQSLNRQRCFKAQQLLVMDRYLQRFGGLPRRLAQTPRRNSSRC